MPNGRGEQDREGTGRRGQDFVDVGDISFQAGMNPRDREGKLSNEVLPRANV